MQRLVQGHLHLLRYRTRAPRDKHVSARNGTEVACAAGEPFSKELLEQLMLKLFGTSTDCHNWETRHGIWGATIATILYVPTSKPLWRWRSIVWIRDPNPGYTTKTRNFEMYISYKSFRLQGKPPFLLEGELWIFDFPSHYTVFSKALVVNPHSISNQIWIVPNRYYL